MIIIIIKQQNEMEKYLQKNAKCYGQWKMFISESFGLFPVYVSMLWEKKIVYILYLISYVQCSCWLSLLIHCLLKSLRTFYLRKTLAQKLWNVHVTKYGDQYSQLSTGSNCWILVEGLLWTVWVTMMNWVKKRGSSLYL